MIAAVGFGMLSRQDMILISILDDSVVVDLGILSTIFNSRSVATTMILDLAVCQRGIRSSIF